MFKKIKEAVNQIIMDAIYSPEKTNWNVFLRKLSEKKQLDFVKRTKNINAQDIEGDTLLIAAVLNFHHLVIPILKSGADINLKPKSQHGYTALMFYMYGYRGSDLGDKNLCSIDILMQYGASINEVNNNGETALMIGTSANKDNPSAIIDLLKHDPDLFIINKDGKTALDIAKNNTLAPSIYNILLAYIEDKALKDNFKNTQINKNKVL